MMWLHISSDVLITLAYLVIAVTLIYIARKRRDLPFKSLFTYLGMVSLACGANHALEVVAIWEPLYRLSGSIKAVTAVASLATAIFLVKLIPKFLATPNSAPLPETKTVSRLGPAADQGTDHLLRMAGRIGRLGAWSVDLPSYTQTWSDEVCVHYGVSPGTVLSFEDARKAYTPASGELLAQVFEGCVRDGTPFDVELEMVKPDGRRAWMRVIGERERNAAGEIYRVQGALQDISESKRAADELTKEREFLAAVVDNVTDGIISCDASGAITLVNQTFREFHGMSDALIPAERWVDYVDLCHPDGITRVSLEEFPLVRALKEGSVRDVELVLVLRSGQTRRVLANGQAFSDAQGTRLGAVVTMHDIAPRRQNEQKLAASEELLREFIRHTPAAIAMMDSELRYMQASERWIKDYHLDGREIIGHSHYEIFPDAPERWKEIHQRVLKGAVESCDEDPFPRADGGMEWLQWEVRPWRQPNGAIGGLIFFTQVITARKNAEATLVDAARRLQLATEVTGTGVWDWDLRTNHIFWDAQMFSLYGLAPAEMTYDLWKSTVHADDFDEQSAILQETVRTRGRSERQFRIRRASDGAERVIYASEITVTDAEGEPLRMVGVNRDITEKLQIEQELKEAKVDAAVREGERRYSFLADAVPQIIWTARPDGGLDYFNKAWFDYTGLDLAQSRDWAWSAVLHPEDLQPCIDRWKRSFTTGEDYEIEYRFKRASDGAFRWHLGRALPRHDEHGSIIQWVGTCTDIDDAKRSKEILQAANDELGVRVALRTSELHAAKEAAEAANQAKSEFLANMS
ncbi:MAG TPA: PAS domain S-box protein, partial [Chthoniobacteraceae bacterium]